MYSEEYMNELELAENQAHIRLKDKEKKRKRLNGDASHKNRLKFLSELNCYPSGAYYVDEKFVRGEGWIPVEKPYYKREYRSNHSGRSKYLKKVANKKVRRNNEYLMNGGSYRKCFDYWWELT